MNIENLMIGDWYYLEASGKKYPYQVKPEDFIKGEIQNFRPILLTSEILEKSGFYEIDKDKYEETKQHIYVLDEGNFSVVGNNMNGYWLSSISLGKSGLETIPLGKNIQGIQDPLYVYTGHSLMYVHQLQHTLKTFEIKKDIIL